MQVRMDDDVAAMLRAQADANGRSLAAEANRLLRSLLDDPAPYPVTPPAYTEPTATAALARPRRRLDR